MPNLASLVFLFQNNKNFSQNQLKKTIKLDLNLTQFKRKKLKSQTNLSDKKKKKREQKPVALIQSTIKICHSEQYFPQNMLVFLFCNCNIYKHGKTRHHKHYIA